MIDLKVKFAILPHLSTGDILLFKILLTIAFISYFVVPPAYAPYVGLSSNIAWLWRL